MGNVLGIASTEHQWNLPKIDPPQSEQYEDNEENSAQNNNPGTVENIHKKCKEVQAAAFRGARLMITKGLNSYSQVTHTACLGGGEHGYRFGATYVGEGHKSNEAYPILLGDTDFNGNMNATIIHQATPKLQWKFAAHFEESELQTAQLATEYRGNDFTAALTFVNPNLFNYTGTGVIHYLQSVTKNLAFGGEVVFHHGSQGNGIQFAPCSLVGKYTSGNSTWSGSVSKNHLHVCYYEKNSETLEIGLEVQTMLNTRESVATIGYQMDIPKSNVVFRGCVDTRMTVCGVFEKRLKPLPFTFALCGRMNCKKTSSNSAARSLWTNSCG